LLNIIDDSSEDQQPSRSILIIRQDLVHKDNDRRSILNGFIDCILDALDIIVDWIAGQRCTRQLEIFIPAGDWDGLISSLVDRAVSVPISLRISMSGCEY